MATLEEQLDRLFGAAKLAHDEDREVAAAELLSTYVRHRPSHATAWHIYGDALRVLGLYHEANQALLTAYELNQSPWVAGRMAQLHHDHGRFSEAEAWFRIAGADPEVAAKGWHWVLRGANLNKMNQFAEAADCFREALGRDEVEAVEAYINLGIVLSAQGKYPEAIAALREALRIEPTHEDAIHAHRKLEGIEQAMSLLEQIPPPASP